MPKVFSLPTAHPAAAPMPSAPLAATPMSGGALVRASLDSAVAIGMLAACARVYEGPFGGTWLILSLLAFSMTFPGVLPRDPAGRNLAFSILARWSAIVALLVFLGWATRTLDSFDHDVLFAWALATPLVQYVAHRVVPGLLPRLLSAEGIGKVAVIAGASSLGSRLAERIEAMPYLGIRLAGYFDDRDPSRLGPERERSL